MAVEHFHSELEDTFRDLSPLSLPHRTLAGTELADLESQGAEPIQNFFKSMGSTTQLVEQTRSIMDSYKNLESVYSNDRDETVAPNGKNPAQERRPALGRKQAKFSLKPAPSHSFPTVDLQSSIDHIEDPVEYFSAVEQHERADKELKKLTGETSTNVMRHPTTTARKRRPGLLGKTVSYKHQFAANDVSSEVLVESHEGPIDGRIYSPLKASADIELSNVLHSKATNRPGTFQTNITDGKSQDNTGAGSEADKDIRTDNVLEKLWSSFEDLDGDEGETLLRESLQMKSIDVGKICLPDLGTIMRIRHNPVDTRVIRGQLKGSEVSQTSPNTRKSPFAAIAALLGRASLISPLKNIYSVPSSGGEPPSGGSSLNKGFDRVSLSPLGTDSCDKTGLVVRGAVSPVTKSGAESNSVKKMHLPVAEADGTISEKTTLDKEFPLEAPRSFDTDTDRCSNAIVIDNDIISSEPDGCLQEEGSGIELDPSFSNHPHVGVGGLNRDSINHTRTEDLASELGGCLQEEGNNIELDPSINNHPDVGVGGLNSDSLNHTRIEDLTSPPHRGMGEKCSSYGTDADTLLGLDDTSHAEANTTVGGHTANVEAANGSSSFPKTAPVMDQDLGGLSTLPKRNHEGNQMASGASLNRGRNVKAVARRRERKDSILKRQSLADNGMLWQSGVRRSSRIRSRPLEYWRGERFLYGRIHDTTPVCAYSFDKSVHPLDSFRKQREAELLAASAFQKAAAMQSLTTVIGVKCASPGYAELKVKSFVPDKYADLVAQAALH